MPTAATLIPVLRARIRASQRLTAQVDNECEALRGVALRVKGLRRVTHSNRG